MTFKVILGLIVSGILVNNFVFEKYLGFAAVYGISKKEGKIAFTGFAVALVMVVSAVINQLVGAALAAKGLSHFATFAAVIVILAVVYLFALIAKLVKKEELGAYFPLIALNSAVLGLCTESLSASLSLAETLFTALGVGLGFTVGCLLFAGVMSRIDMRHVPKAFRGLPVSLLAAAIISMALIAFK